MCDREPSADAGAAIYTRECGCRATTGSGRRGGDRPTCSERRLTQIDKAEKENFSGPRTLRAVDRRKAGAACRLPTFGSEMLRPDQWNQEQALRDQMRAVDSELIKEADDTAEALRLREQAAELGA